LKKHLNTADKLGVRYCVVLGTNELEQKQMWVKDLVEQREFTEPF
jgi:histidyl-tRNA synthetase